MRDIAARSRSGLTAPTVPATEDPRVHVDLAHLRALEGRAAAIRLSPRQPARSVLNGRHASRLRGRGLDFEELRGYLPGDDVRSIDWKVTARTGEAHVRVFTEERDRPALIVVDQRMSMFFGTVHAMKSVIAAEVAALAAFSVLAQGDRVGGIVFGDDIIAEFRPERSRGTLTRFLAALAEANRRLHAEVAPAPPLPLNDVLTSVGRIARRNHLVLILSDFDGIDARTESLLGGLARRNDVLLGLVTDPSAEGLKPGMRLAVSDGALQAEIDTGDGTVRKALAEATTGRLAEILGWQARLGVPVLPLSAGEETVPQLRRLMGLG